MYGTIITDRNIFFIGDRQKGSRAAFKEVFGFEPVVVGAPSAHVGSPSLCAHVDCDLVGVFVFPCSLHNTLGMLCEIHKLAGMLHKDKVIWAAHQKEPEQPSTLQCDENTFAWDDDSEAALMCNEVLY